MARPPPCQHVPDRKLVVDPRTGEADGEDQGCGDAGQALVEIGAVLLGDVVETGVRDGVPRRGLDRIEIADHRIGNAPGGQRHIRATIRCHKGRRHGQHLIQIRDGTGTRAKQGDW